MLCPLPVDEAPLGDAQGLLEVLQGFVQPALVREQILRLVHELLEFPV